MPAIDGDSRSIARARLSTIFSIDRSIDRSNRVLCAGRRRARRARDVRQSRARDGVDDDGVVGGVRGGATTRWDVVDGVDGVDGVVEARRGGDSDAHASRGARRWRATVVVVVVVVVVVGGVGEATETASGGGGVRWRDDERVRAQWRVVVRA